MKKEIILLVFLSIFIFNGFSQSQKNDLKLTVSVLPLFGSSDGFTSGINGLVIKPAIGYYISYKTSLEVNLTYTTLNDLNVGNVNSFYKSYAFVPTLRNNFYNKEKIRFFAEFGIGLGAIKYDADDSNYRNTEHKKLSGGISVINLGLGMNYYFNKDFGLELIIPYISVNNITSNSSNNAYSGLGPTIGLTYKLN